MNPTVILALIAELYEKVAVLTEENRQLREPATPPADN